MLDGVMRKLIDPIVDRAGAALSRLGVGADAVTALGLALGLGGAVAIGLRWFGLGLTLILLSRLADGLDGAVARATVKTDFGGYFDIAADFLFYGAVPFGFIVADPEANALAGGFLLLSFYFNGSTFLGYAVLAEKHGLTTTGRGIKSLYFTAGLAEGTETILLFAAICIWPGAFPLLAFAFGLLTFVTAFSRLILARTNFASASDRVEGE